MEIVVFVIIGHSVKYFCFWIGKNQMASNAVVSVPLTNEVVASYFSEEKNCMAKDSNEIDLLPEEMLIKILSYLSLNELVKVSRVCRRWNALTKSPALWKRVHVRFSPDSCTHNRSQHDATMKFITDVLPSCASSLKLMFKRCSWSQPLHFQEMSVNLQNKCPKIQMLTLYDAKLSSSLPSVIRSCSQILENIKVLIFDCCEFDRDDRSIYESYRVISKIEALHLRNCRIFRKPLLSEMRFLKSLCVWQCRPVEINPWFCDDVSFLNRLEILDLGYADIDSFAFLEIKNRGFNLCYSNISDTDLIFNRLKIVCLNQGMDNYLTFNGVLSLIQSCPSLQEVYVDNKICKYEYDAVQSLIAQFEVKVIKVLHSCYHEKRYQLYK